MKQGTATTKFIDTLLAIDEIKNDEKNTSNIGHLRHLTPQSKLAHSVNKFTKLKRSVFRELEEKDHIEQERITWFKLQQWIEFGWFDKLYQNDNIKKHYLSDIAEAAISYKSYTDKILIKYFNCPFKTNKSNQSAQAFITNNTAEDAFVHFDFPYFFAKGLYHFVLFSRYNISNSLGKKQMRRLISNYISDAQYTGDILSKNEKYDFLYYEERENISFFRNLNEEKEESPPLLCEIIDTNIFPNIIHIFICVTDEYRVRLGANGASWADESFLWNESCSIIQNKDVHKFGREEKWIRKYIADRTKFKKKPINNEEKEKHIGFNSIRDKILIKEFKCKSEINKENNKLMAIIDDTTPRYIWAENLYPYFYEKGIQHNLVWYLDKTLDTQILEKFIIENIGNDREYIYWENPPHLKSIPDLDHFQVISVNMNAYMKDIKHLLYVNTQYKWQDFVNNSNIMNKHLCGIKYGMNERICRRYLEQIEETKIRFESLICADLRRYFKCKIKTNEFGKLIIDEQSSNDSEKYEKYVFVKDRYHWNLEQGLRQYLLVVWNKYKWHNSKIKEIIEFELEKKQNTFVFWQDPEKETEKEKELFYYHVIHNEKSVY